MALPTEILRRRTRSDLLRERQRSLQQRVQEPQVSPEEKAEFERITQQIAQERQVIDRKLEEVGQEIEIKRQEMANVQIEIQKIQDRGGGTPSSLRAWVNNLSEDITRLQQKEIALGTSATAEEAAQRIAFRERQVAFETEKQRETREFTPKEFVRTAEPTATERALQMSLPPDLRHLPPEDVRAGQDLIPFTPIPPRIERGFFDVTKDVLFGEKGKEIVGIRTPTIVKIAGKAVGVDIPSKVTGEQISQVLRKGGLPGRTASLFIPETPADVAFFGGTVALGGAPGVVGKVVRVGITTTGTVIALQKDRPTEERIAGGIVALAPFAGKFVRGGIKSVKDFPKLGKKGSAQFSELESFFKKDVKKKSELQKALDAFSSELGGRREGKVIRETTLSEKVNLISKVFEKIKQTKDPVLRKKQVEGMVKILKSELGDTGAKNVFREYLAQEGVMVKTPQGAAKLKKIEFEIQSELQKTGVVPAELVSLDQQIEQKSLFFVGEKEALTTEQKERAALILKTAQAQIPRQLFFQPQVLAQVPKLATPTALKQPTVTRMAKPTRKISVRKIPKPKVKIPKLSKANIKKIRKALAKLKGKGVDVMVGMVKGKQKILHKNLPPKLALKKAQEFVDENIQASFRIISTGKKIKRKDIKKVKLSGKFRPSKRNPLFQVEKRKYRLDSPGEKRQIKKSKRKK